MCFFFLNAPQNTTYTHLTHCCCIYQSRPAMSVRIINMPPLSMGCFLFPSRCSGGLNTTTMIIIHPGYSFFPLFLNVRLIFFYPRSPYYVVSPVNTTHTRVCRHNQTGSTQRRRRCMRSQRHGTGYTLYILYAFPVGISCEQRCGLSCLGVIGGG